MKKLEVSDIAGDNVNSAAAIENSLACPQNLSIELPHDAGSPLLDIYLGEGKPGCQNQVVQRCPRQHYSQQPKGC